MAPGRVPRMGDMTSDAAGVTLKASRLPCAVAGTVSGWPGRVPLTAICQPASRTGPDGPKEEIAVRPITTTALRLAAAVSTAAALAAAAAAPAAAKTYPPPAIHLQGTAAPYTWSLVSGQFPPGLGLTTFSDPRDANDELAGTPTTVGTYTFTMRVTDYNGQQATQQFTVTVHPPLQVATTALPAGTVGKSYRHDLDLNAQGGAPPVHLVHLRQRPLPPGLTLDTTPRNRVSQADERVAAGMTSVRDPAAA